MTSRLFRARFFPKMPSKRFKIAKCVSKFSLFINISSQISIFLARFISTAAFSHLVVIVGRNPDAANSAAFLIFRCSHNALLPVLSQYLQEVCGKTHCHLAGVQAITAELLRRDHPENHEVQHALQEQGVYDYLFKLASDNARFDDCFQSCLQLMVDLWQFYPGTLRPQVSDQITEHLRSAALHETNMALAFVAFGLIFRLLKEFCNRRDGHNTPIIFRCLVKSLIECPSEWAWNSNVVSVDWLRGMVLANLSTLLQETRGVPVDVEEKCHQKLPSKFNRNY